MVQLYHGAMTLLRALLDAILPPRSTARRMRSTSFASLAPYVEPRMLDAHRTGLLPYRHPLVHAAIVESKFYADARAHAVLGAVLAEYLRDAEIGLFSSSTPVLIPIPLSRARMRERGHNQSARITQEAIRTLGTSFKLNTHLLRRTRHTPPQTRLPRAARLANMHDAFAAQDVDTHTTYVLIDDVSTTGATLHAARSALIEAGAHEVICIALAY